MSETDASNRRMPWEGLESDGPVLVLVRHGRTAWNAERRFLGRTDIPLDAVGQAGAEALGARLRGRFDAVYSSPLSRAWQTAAQLADEVEAVEALSELHQGALEGLTMPEGLERHAAYFETWMANPESARVPGGGESLGDVRDRAVPALLELSERHEHGVLAVVTHQMVIAAVCCTAAGEPLREYRRFTVGNLGSSVLLRRDGALAAGPTGLTL